MDWDELDDVMPSDFTIHTRCDISGPAIVIGIEAKRWPSATAGLVTVPDLTEYEAGSQEIDCRSPGPFRG